MKIDTKYFGRVDIEEEKIIHFGQGLFGFEDYHDYTILYDIDKEDEPFFSWLQCVTEQSLAFPIVNPFRVKEDYNPVVEDALLAPLGDFTPDDLAVFLLATVPAQPENTTVNMKAPLVISRASRQGIQIIAENEDYEVRHRLIPETEQ